MRLNFNVCKLTSARFWMTILFSVTYCLVIGSVTYAMISKTVTVETYVALLASFVLIVREITDSYFKRTDRVSQSDVVEDKEKK